MLLEDPPGVKITEEMIVAAWFHDIYEDTDYASPTLASPFGYTVDQYVIELTNIFTCETFPDMPRAAEGGRDYAAGWHLAAGTGYQAL